MASARSSSCSRRTRCCTCFCITSSKISQRLRPRFFARYMATSAWRTSVLGSVLVTSDPVTVAMPMLIVTVTGPAGSCTGASTVRTIRSHRSPTSSTETKSVQSTNSSPPIRASVSLERRMTASRRANCWSSLSPASCPNRSLTSLNRSRSQKNTATVPPERWARASASPMWSLSSRRLASPVSGSCSARNVSCSSVWRRSVTSRTLVTMPLIAAASMQLVSMASTQRHCPDRWRIRSSTAGCGAQSWGRRASRSSRSARSSGWSRSRSRVPTSSTGS